MRKLTLDMDALAVESFAPGDAEAVLGGTVDAHAVTAIRCGSGGASCFTSCRGDLRDACTCPVA